jgi:hypothetical protein
VINEYVADIGIKLATVKTKYLENYGSFHFFRHKSYTVLDQTWADVVGSQSLSAL